VHHERVLERRYASGLQGCAVHLCDGKIRQGSSEQEACRKGSSLAGSKYASARAPCPREPKVKWSARRAVPDFVGDLGQRVPLPRAFFPGDGLGDKGKDPCRVITNGTLRVRSPMPRFFEVTRSAGRGEDSGHPAEVVYCSWAPDVDASALHAADPRSGPRW